MANIKKQSWSVRLVAALTLGTNSGGLPRPSLMGHYKALFTALFSLCVLFSVTDMLSTAVALRMGLIESNVLLLAIGKALGLDIISALGVTKIVFIMGSFWAAFYGMQTKNQKMRRRALLVLAGLVVMLCIVSLNNLYWITVS